MDEHDSKIYMLKHRDVDVLEFSIDRISNNVRSVHVFDETFSPINTVESEGSQITTFNNWLVDRCISSSRDGVERITSAYNVKDLKEIMLMSYGLSLSDHFWIDKMPLSGAKWKDINLFENRYDEMIGKMLFDKELRLVNDAVDFGYRNPGFTTGGDLKKYWKYSDVEKMSYLIKGGSEPYLQEPFNEYFSHLLLKELGFRHTPYTLETEGGEVVSCCPCIADKNIEMVSAVNLYRKYRNNKTYYGFVGLGQKKGCIGFENEVNKMIVLDYLIDNTDRHWNNFGIVRDSASGSWKGLIPIYDNGYSLWNRRLVNSSSISNSLSFGVTNEECIDMVNIHSYVKKLPDMTRLFDDAFDGYRNIERKADLRKGIQERQEYIQKYMDTVKPE